MVVRGKSDHLDHAAIESFVHILSNYISTKLSSGCTLWDFGPYGALDANLEKSAPLIDHLLRNEDLWRLCIQFMPMAKMLDCNMSYALRRCMSIVKDGVNNQGISDSLFITWCIRSMHVQLTHLRMLRKYPARYAYRVMQEPPENQDRLAALVNTIVLGSDYLTLLTPIKTAMGSEETNAPRKVAHAARTSAIAGIVPTMFLQDVIKEAAANQLAAATQAVHYHQREIDALKTTVQDQAVGIANLTGIGHMVMSMIEVLLTCYIEVQITHKKSLHCMQKIWSC